VTRQPLRDRDAPGLRYLRGRGNRRVRKVRRLRGLLRVWKVLLWHLVPAALLVLGGIRGIRHLASSTSFALETVEVQGALRTTPTAIAARLQPFLGDNLPELDLEEVAARVAQDPWVLQASVKRVFPHTLRVIVTERTPAAWAVLDGLVQLVDETGVAIGPVGSDAREFPVLTGLDALGSDARRAALQRGVRAVGRLRQATRSWIEDVSEMDLSLSDRIGVVTREPGPLVLLDPEEAERNVGPYLELRREIEDDVGPIASVDLRWRDRIAVLPLSETKLESN